MHIRVLLLYSTVYLRYTAYQSSSVLPHAGLTDYDCQRLRATKAMRQRPMGEVRRPNPHWAGLGFSSSMPESVIREGGGDGASSSDLVASKCESILEQLEGEEEGEDDEGKAEEEEERRNSGGGSSLQVWHVSPSDDLTIVQCGPVDPFGMQTSSGNESNNSGGGAMNPLLPQLPQLPPQQQRRPYQLQLFGNSSAFDAVLLPSRSSALGPPPPHVQHHRQQQQQQHPHPSQDSLGATGGQGRDLDLDLPFIGPDDDLPSVFARQVCIVLSVCLFVCLTLSPSPL